MAGQVSLKWGYVSITGNFRDNNEDNFFIDPQARFFLVADGMGGQSAGEKASELAIDLITEKLQQDGVTAFAASFDQLLGALEKKRNAMVGAEATGKV